MSEDRLQGRRPQPLIGAWLAGMLLLSPGALPAGAERGARDIIAAVYQQDSSHDAFMSASFDVFDRDGHVTTKSFSYRRIGPPGDSRTLVVFTDPAEIRDVALLSINRPGLNDRQYIYVPATQRVRSVAPQQRASRFIGTDFTFEDIGERELDDFDYQLLGEGGPMQGHGTQRIRATPVDAARSQYRFLLYWVALDAPVILQVEMYDAQGQLVRIMRASEIRRISGIWGARHLQMRTVQDGTRTELRIREVRFNTHPDETLFTPQALGAAR